LINIRFEIVESKLREKRGFYSNKAYRVIPGLRLAGMFNEPELILLSCQRVGDFMGRYDLHRDKGDKDGDLIIFFSPN
jgi:hypothetical protein